MKDWVKVLILLTIICATGAAGILILTAERDRSVLASEKMHAEHVAQKQLEDRNQEVLAAAKTKEDEEIATSLKAQQDKERVAELAQQEKAALDTKLKEQWAQSQRKWDLKVQENQEIIDKLNAELTAAAAQAKAQANDVDRAFDARVAQAEAETLRLYPSAGISDSPLLSRMHAIYRSLESTNDPWLYRPDLVLTLAHTAADQLKIAPSYPLEPVQQREALPPAPAPAPATTSDLRYAKSPINPYALMSPSLRESMLRRGESPYDELKARMDQMESDMRQAEIDAEYAQWRERLNRPSNFLPIRPPLRPMGR